MKALPVRTTIKGGDFIPVIKHISIHSDPMGFIEYIENCEKTDKGKLISGLNISTESKNAYDEFKLCYEVCARENFALPDTASKEKRNVRLHHYIQSFSPDENISPEEAHAIGVELAKSVFGEQHQIIISTHIDKGHIHNHFAVAAYDLNRKHWHDNMKTLKMCRSISDEIALRHGLSIIDPQHRNTMKYSEWLERKSGNSVKQQIQKTIDRYILDESVKSINDLADRLRSEGCEVRLGKFMTIKPPQSKRSFRADNLDKKRGGYSIRELEYRIRYKDSEISDEAIFRLSGIQREFAIQMRVLQISFYRKKSKEVQYADLLESAEQLMFLYNNRIRSVEGLRQYVDTADEKYRSAADESEMLRQRIKLLSENEVLFDFQLIEQLKTELAEAEQREQTLSAERSRAAKIYRQYIDEHPAPVPQEERRREIHREYER